MSIALLANNASYALAGKKKRFHVKHIIKLGIACLLIAGIVHAERVDGSERTNTAGMKFFFKVYELEGKRNKKALAGVRIQCKKIHETRWRDFGGPEALSQAGFSGSADAGRFKGRQCNLAAAGTVPQLKGETDCSDTIFRLWKKDYESVFFDLASLIDYRDKNVFCKEIGFARYGHSDVQLLLRISKAQDNSALEGAHVQYLWEGEWHDFRPSGKDEANKSHLSTGKFKALEETVRRKTPRQTNYSAEGKAPVGFKNPARKQGIRYPVFRVVKEGYEPAYVVVPRFSKQAGTLKFYTAVSLKPRGDVRVNLAILNALDKTPVAGACVQYYSWFNASCPPRNLAGLPDTRWCDLGKPKPPSKGRYRSKSALFNAGNTKVNYSILEHLPDFRARDRRHKRVVLRVVRKGFASEYFFIDSEAASKKPEFFSEIKLRPHGLICRWPLDKGSGETCPETTGQGNAGKISGAAWVKQNGRTALKFDGADDVVDFGTNPVYEQSEAITVLLWIKPSKDVALMQSLIGRAWRNPYALFTRKGNGLELSLFLGACKGFGQFHYMGRSGGAYCLTKPNILNPGKWNLVGFSYGNPTDERIRLYHNGKVVAERSLRKRGGWGIKPYLLCVPSNQPLSIGYFDGMGYFAGLIDDVRMYNYELSKEEVGKIYREKK